MYIDLTIIAVLFIFVLIVVLYERITRNIFRAGVEVQYQLNKAKRTTTDSNKTCL